MKVNTDEVLEEWRPVVGYEGLYEVSNLGRVRGLDRIIANNRPGTTRTWRGRILRQTIRDTGHRTLHLARDGHPRARGVHCLVLEAFVGPCPPGMEACHNNGIPNDNRLTNLRWDTRLANMLDRITHGTDPNARKLRCDRGHLLRAPNLARCPQRPRSRHCLACGRARANGQYAERKGYLFDMQARADEHYRQIMQGVAL